MPETQPQVIAEFKRGLADRVAGRPMMASDSDAINDCPHCSDAYACGYDPHGEQFTSPDVVALTAALARAANVTIPPCVHLPRNRCEFPND